MAVAIRTFRSKNHNKCVGCVIAVGPLLMRCRNIYLNFGLLTIANDIELQPYTSERGCRIQKGTTLVHSIQLRTFSTTNMASLQKPTSSSANQKQDRLVATQKEAQGPARNVTQRRSLTSDQVEKVKAWRCKYIIFNLKKHPRSSYSIAAAATGTLLENRHKPTPAGPSDGSEKIGAAKGPSLDSEWGDNLILLDSEWGDNLILL